MDFVWAIRPIQNPQPTTNKILIIKHLNQNHNEHTK